MEDYNLKNIQKFIKDKYFDIGKRFVKFDLANPEIYQWMVDYVEPINDGSFNLSRIVYHVMNGLDEVICDNESCNLPVKWNKTVYNSYCSPKCSNSSKKKKDDINKTLIKNYGNTLGVNQEIRKKIKKTMQEKYGVNSSFESKEIRDKAKETIKERYGVDNVGQLEEIQKKIRQTNLKKYGVKYGLQSKEIQEKAKQTNLKKHGGTSPMHNETVKDKVRKTMHDKYGVEYYWQKNIDENVLERLNDRGYLIEEHHVNKKNCTQISNQLGVDITTVIRYLNRHQIEQKYYVQNSKYEEEIESFLQENNILYSKNDRSIIQPYELDFILNDYDIAIEFCGLYWHCEYYKDKNYHRMKYDMAKEKNIQLITIFEDEWLNNKDLILRMILHKINCSKEKKIFARSCEIKIASKIETRDFLNKNHIQGQGKASISLSLVCDNEMVAIMTFRKHKRGYELNRFCTSCIVVGGFSKLLKSFRRDHKELIVSYIDLRWANGKTYEMVGFKKEKYLKPDYFYINRDKRYHKFNFRKKYLKKRLPKYDSNLSEKDNCFNNGIHRIYDCGKIRYVYI